MQLIDSFKSFTLLFAYLMIFGGGEDMLCIGVGKESGSDGRTVVNNLYFSVINNG